MPRAALGAVAPMGGTAMPDSAIGRALYYDLGGYTPTCNQCAFWRNFTRPRCAVLSHCDIGDSNPFMVLNNATRMFVIMDC